DGGPGGLMAVANLGLDAHRSVERRDRNPIQVAGAERLDGRLRLTAYLHLLGRVVYLYDVERRGRGEPQSLALSDGEVVDALMVADHLARCRHQLAGGIGQRLALLVEVGVDELLVVAAGDEADLLR